MEKTMGAATEIKQPQATLKMKRYAIAPCVRVTHITSQLPCSDLNCIPWQEQPSSSVSSNHWLLRSFPILASLFFTSCPLLHVQIQWKRFANFLLGPSHSSIHPSNNQLSLTYNTKDTIQDAKNIKIIAHLPSRQRGTEAIWYREIQSN